MLKETIFWILKCTYYIYSTLNLNTLKLFIVLNWQYIGFILVLTICISVLLFLILILLKLVDLLFKYKYNKKILFKDKMKYICRSSLFIFCFGFISCMLEGLFMEYYRGFIPMIPWYYLLFLISLFIGVIIIKILKLNNILTHIKHFFLSLFFFFFLRNTLLLLVLFIGFYINEKCGSVLWMWLTNNIFKVIFFEFYFSMCLMPFCSDSNFLVSLFKAEDSKVSNIRIEGDITSKFDAAFMFSIETWNEKHPASFSNIIDKLKAVHHIQIDETQAELLSWFNQSADFKKNPWKWVCMGYSGGKAVFIVPFEKVDLTMGNPKVDVFRFLQKDSNRQLVLDTNNIKESHLDDGSGNYILFKSRKIINMKEHFTYHLYQKHEGANMEYFTIEEWRKNKMFYIDHSTRKHFLYFPNKVEYQRKALYVRDPAIANIKNEKAFIKTDLMTPSTYTVQDENEGLSGVQVFTSIKGKIINPLVREKLIKLPKNVPV